MRKFDCNSFRITGNTNFKKKLTSFVSKSIWVNPAMKVRVANEIRRHTAGAEVFDRCLNDCYEGTPGADLGSILTDFLNKGPREQASRGAPGNFFLDF